jgi:hypothetical protein
MSRDLHGSLHLQRSLVCQLLVGNEGQPIADRCPTVCSPREGMLTAVTLAAGENQLGGSLCGFKAPQSTHVAYGWCWVQP